MQLIRQVGLKVKELLKKIGKHLKIGITKILFKHGKNGKTNISRVVGRNV